MPWRIEQRNGIHLPDIDWHLDARKPVKRSFVSHAHFDHMGDHDEIVCSPGTAALMKRRSPGNRKWRIHEFGETFELDPGIEATLYPAGHIVGSAMLRIKSELGSLLYTGDFKLSKGSAAENCQPVPSETLIMETTYGIPRYTFPPESEIAADIVRFCRETLDNGETPVLYGYSLGKSQSILKWLADSNLPAMLHPKSLELTKTCEELGWSFPPYLPFVDGSHSDKVIISPPQPKNSSWIKRIRNPKTAIVSGWAIDSSAIYRYQCDKAFPLSDHADYLDLQSLVAQVRPKTIYTVHGFAKEFAQTLREQGYDALALGKENQLALSIETPEATPEAAKPSQEQAPFDANPTSFSRLTNCANAIAATDSASKRIELIQEQLSKLSPDDIATSCQLLSGTPLCDDSGETLEVDKNLVLQAVLTATNTTLAEYKSIQPTIKDRRQRFLKLFEKRGEIQSRDLQYIQSFLENFASAPSPTFRFSFLSEELRKLGARESLLLIEVVEGNLQNGATSEQIETAIARHFQAPTSTLQRAHRRCSNLREVVQAAASDSLADIEITPFRPVPFNLSRKTNSQEELFENLGERNWIEDQFDGMRCQIHKVREHAEIYDKRLNRVTHQFPEIIEAAKLIPQDFIADAEIVPWLDERPLPMERLKERLARKGEELFLGEETQVLLWLFDLLWINEEDLLDLPLAKRRSQLDAFTVNARIRISPVTYLENPLQIDALADAARMRGSEGIVCKNPNAPYDLGAHPDSWLTFSGTDSVPAASKG